MEEYASNSHKSKEEHKKVEKVISGTASKRKKSKLQKFSDVFISEDVGNVKSYIFFDVLVPAVKKAVSDIVTNGIDMILYGGSGKSKRKTSASKASYRNYYDNDTRNQSGYSKKFQYGFDYDDVVFETRGDAESVLDSMNEIIANFNVVSVSDLYDLANIPNDNYAANKYGWSNIEGCRAVRIPEGYILKLPKPKLID